MRTTLLLICIAIVFTSSPANADEYDVVIYGGTSAAITAAVQVKRMGKSVVIVCPDKHLGGLSSGGLGWTDTGNKSVIGGLSREFYHRVWKHYQKPDAWKWQTREKYGNRGQGTKAIDGEHRTMWIFEPQVAEQVFEDFVSEYRIPVHRDKWLDRKKGVTKSQGKISSITMLSGETYSGRMFIDATYEGDLMATAGVSYHVGREARSKYGEKWNGVQVGVLHHSHWFRKPVDPYVKPGNPSSGVLPRISPDPPGEKGDGDHRVQAYCFRMCLTNVPENRIPFPKPKGYDPNQYELMLRVFATGWRQTFGKFDPIPNQKTDTNNHGPFSTDNIGMNYDYPDGSYERRKEIIKEHETYQKGMMYFIANDPRVPPEIQKKMKEWGLPKDEFKDNGNWSHQLYIREARRMVGSYVMTEHDCLLSKDTPQSIGMGSYTMDSHNVQRYIKPNGTIQNEGDIGVKPRGPYHIAYGSLVPKKNECQNLLVPVCVSSSHIAFGSIRMEPVFMILGQSAATAAVLAINEKIAVQDVAYDSLRMRLLADGQVLKSETPVKSGTGIDLSKLKGVVIDDDQAKATGQWLRSTSIKPYVRSGYRHDDNKDQGNKSLRFDVKLPSPGDYEVRHAYSASSNRATNVAITVHHADGVKTVTINQKKTPPIDGLFISLGKFRFEKAGGWIDVSNKAANGYVVVDAIQFVPAK